MAEKNREKGENNPFLAHNILATIQNIEILATNNIPLSDEIIEDFSHTYSGTKIFDFIDTIMAKNIKKSLEMNKNFAENMTYNTIDIFFGSLIGILKKNLYILSLKEKNFSREQILKTLP